MKNDVFLTLEKSDLEFYGELEFESDTGCMSLRVETCFDVDKKFGLHTADDEDTWVNMYIGYNPFNKDVSVVYFVRTENGDFGRNYEPTDSEIKMMTNFMEESCIKEMKLNCRDVLIRYFMEDAEDKTLVCEKVSDNEYQIRSIWKDFVLYKEDATGRLKDHVGHKIEYATYDTDDDYSFSIECLDCNEVLLTQTEPDEIVEDIEVEFLYENYRIMITPDYKKALNTGDIPPDLYCEVYSIKDTEFKNNLGTFNLMSGFEYTEYTVEAIEGAIKKMMDDSFSFYELQRRETEFNRADELLARSVGYIAELTCIEDLRETLIEKLDMTEEEADKMVESFEPEMEAEQGMTLG